MADLEIEEVELDLSKLEVNPETGEVRERTAGPLFETPQSLGHKYSVSLLSDFAQCGAKGYARLTRQPATRGIALVNGIAIHTSLERYLKERADPKAAYEESFKSVAEENEILLKGTEASKAFETGKEIVDITIAEMNKGNFMQKVDPKNVEQSFVFERNGRLYIGRFDLLYFEEEQTYDIIDFKSGRNSPSFTELESSWQFTMYSYAAKHSEGLPTKGLWPAKSVWWHLRGKEIIKAAKGRKEQRQFFFETQRTEEFVEDEFVNTIEPLAARMERGDFVRTRGKWCSWCPYFNQRKLDCGVDMPTRRAIHAGDNIDTPPDLSKGIVIV